MFEDLNEEIRKGLLNALRVPGYWDGISDAPLSLMILHNVVGCTFDPDKIVSVGDSWTPETTKYVNEIVTSKVTREKTLTYIHKLLEEGEIKVGKYSGGGGIADEYTGTPDEIINRIRTEWNNTKEGVVNENPSAYEMGIHIVLKKDPWPVWR